MENRNMGNNKPNRFPEDKQQPQPNRKHKSDQENLYPHEPELNEQDKSNDPSFSERNDVTPPKAEEFPSVGRAKTDFESRKQGRTTGRMVGHEPGTEGI
ncbi:hypothetical protein C8P68_101563 [Mucilaginibacter yixingensis]|uniref:Uncharacterized protein n=1 Tax=Mucilaginibacter yixingensis TaxID=1295612 RepID=A0A2T5JFY9_9SPHI|nr:hypothetical protein [Mucilaginibacter yixingensis]PTR01329.1 hypothetical protein C8P68_101563 [Mucilaginibacter yixingensis]